MEPEVQPVGGDAVVARTVRRVPPRSIDPTLKNLQSGDLVGSLFEVDNRGATYSFLTDRNANLTEGSGFNVILVKDGVLYTPDRGVVQGITRKSVLDAARKYGIEVHVEHIPVDMTYQADGIFMPTTAGGIMLDGQPVKGRQVGPVTKKIWNEYWAMPSDPAYSFETKY